MYSMFHIKKRYFPFLLICFLISSTSAVPEKIPARPRLLILHPADTRLGLVSEKLDHDFREIFKSRGVWQVIPREEMNRKFIDYKKDPNKPCNDLDCAFDAGTILQARYALYSSLTIFQNYYIFNLHLVDISVTKVVWSENGEVPIKTGRNPGEALLHRLRQIIKTLKPGEIKKSAVKFKGTLGILNLSPNSDYSKILFDRLSSHAYTSGEYDLVGKAEFDFILESLDIKPSAIVPKRDSLIPLGKRLGVDYLIYSLLKKEKNKFNLKLMMFDIKQDQLIREWPYRSSNFQKLLKFENKFFSNLSQADVSAKSLKPGSSAWKWIAGPISFVSAGVLGYLTWTEHTTFKDKHDEWKKEPRTSQKWESRPALKEEAKRAWLNRNVYGILGGVMFSGTIILISF